MFFFHDERRICIHEDKVGFTALLYQHGGKAHDFGGVIRHHPA
jgi:hypothetical protein